MNVKIITALGISAAAVLASSWTSTSAPRVADVRTSLAPPATRGVTIELLSTIDLGPEIEDMQGRQLRTRRVTIEPGGVFGPVHDHKGWPEDKDTIHWLENRGTTRAVEISVDIVSASG